MAFYQIFNYFWFFKPNLLTNSKLDNRQTVYEKTANKKLYSLKKIRRFILYIIDQKILKGGQVKNMCSIAKNGL